MTASCVDRSQHAAASWVRVAFWKPEESSLGETAAGEERRELGNAEVKRWV